MVTPRRSIVDATWNELVNQIKALPHPQGTVLHLWFLEGLSIAEIAVALEMTEDEAEAEYNRGMADRNEAQAAAAQARAH